MGKNDHLNINLICKESDSSICKQHQFLRLNDAVLASGRYSSNLDVIWQTFFGICDLTLLVMLVKILVVSSYCEVISIGKIIGFQWYLPYIPFSWYTMKRYRLGEVWTRQRTERARKDEYMFDWEIYDNVVIVRDYICQSDGISGWIFHEIRSK